MTESLSKSGIFAVTLFTGELAASQGLYPVFLNAEPIWGDAVSTVFKTGGAMINLLQNVAVADLIAPT